MADVIVALDLPPGTDALAFLDRIPDARWVKVGSIPMTREGPRLVESLVARGLQVFLDLKWHDIPHTVAEAVTVARGTGVAMATVHALGGEAMMAAAAAAAGDELALVGVTVLTSHTPASYARAVGRPAVELPAEVERHTRAAVAAGLRGIVCSLQEVAPVRRAVGEEALIVVPGIRRAGDAPGDQARVATPAAAAAAGATHLVVGRPVLQAADPAATLREFQREARCVPS